jgi:CheY-like chemotaxis protein
MTRTAGLNVIVADERADDAAALQRVLGRDGHRIRIAADGEAALRAAIADPPDVVLLDIDMPKMDGCKVAAAMRVVAWPARPLVVTVTGHDGDDYRRRAGRAGVDVYLTKPLEPDTLRAILSTFNQALMAADASRTSEGSGKPAPITAALTPIAGPYHPLQCHVGDTLFCEIRGTVTVAGISNTPVPWPYTQSGGWGRPSPILCKELARAVRQEAAVVVCWLFGVAPQTVRRWRKALGVPLRESWHP